MSQHVATRRITAPDITARKGGDPIVSLTSYHAHTAAIADKYVDFLLVGDSLGMVVQGRDSTLAVTLADIAYHTACVARGSARGFVIADMPFGSYQEGPEQAFRNAATLMAAGAQRRRGHGSTQPGWTDL